MDFCRAGSVVGEERRVGCVVRMSQRICRVFICNASWPLLKQRMKRVRFSSARVCIRRVSKVEEYIYSDGSYLI